MTTTRILITAALVLGARPAAAQIIKVPKPVETRRPVAVAAAFGFLQTQGRYDGPSDTYWSLSEALQYRASVELGMRSGALGLAGTLASVPIRRVGGLSAQPNSNGHIDLRQFLATFRTPEVEGAHQIVEVGIGMSQWAGYSGSDPLTAAEREPRNAFTLVVGYGFGFTVGDRASLMIVQDMGTLWGSGAGLPAGESRMQRQYITRVGVRYRFVGKR